ncbi:sugar ABC transporter substrate-binding protein [Blastopirellula sp. JC732]|uniref:Sugar ABC transporter substrate-binding protein n=1 Tax=Blastopirellula sediminis TaxID=2894196 RepID=A0A9X1MLL4_9BACT|nr:sugar ABC transporter substrate-binding protein [Blastopirellula sediminis]MCC9608646.1 sugar ABC transporter substrate-binding protein [Blastopirellula sediminis]MCC9628577.1 sugar ABC transporter substrate-binding protein [Blastopirellula sediminis]
MNKSPLLCLLLLALIGCNGDSTAKPDTDAPKKPKVALIMKSLANEFFSTMADGAEKYQAEHPEEFDLVVNGIKDERDLSRQVALVDEMIAANVDAIVIAPADSKALVPALRRAKKAGVIVVNIDNRLDAAILEAEGVSIPFVGPDNKAGAKTTGSFLAQSLKPGDAVCILEGVRTSFNGQQRFAGFEEAMNDAGAKIVDHQSAEWEMSKANTIAASMLSEHPETKAILAANDSMALGAVAAVKAAGRSGDVLIIGFDNISAVQEAIREGKILATADQHGDQLAVFGIQNALKLLEDPDAKIEDVETPVDLITKESLAK